MALSWSTPKDPDEVLDYQIDWSTLLGTDTIITSTWVFADAQDNALVMDSNTHTTTTATVWLSAGTAGTTYQLTNRITTLGGRTRDQTMKLKVKDK